jgi:hypothetical protein
MFLSSKKLAGFKSKCRIGGFWTDTDKEDERELMVCKN